MIRVGCLSFILFFALHSYLMAFDLELPEDDNPNIPWDISADDLKYDINTKQYIARGNVVVGRGDKKISADFIRFDHQNMMVEASGHVVMVAGNDLLSGERLDLDLNTETGTLYQGDIFLHESHFHLKGERIAKVGKHTYAAERATVSTCDGEPPAWKITARNLRVTIEGYAWATHAAFWAKSVPVVYTPVMVIPMKRKRQSGLLVPSLGYSDRKGIFYQQPVYWVINDQADATVYGHYMEERGFQTGSEFRYVRDEHSRGVLMLDLLEDSKTDDCPTDCTDDCSAECTPEAIEEWGYGGDETNRPNSDRYWLRMKHDFELPFAVTGKLDMDIVSDQDYLPEFKSGYTGFDDTETHFLKQFGRDLDDYNDTVRKNSLLLNRTREQFHVSGGVSWYDDVVERRFGETDTALHKLPFVGIHSRKQQIFESPVYWKLDTEYDNFYRKDGTGGQRLDLYPRFYVSRRFAERITVEPSVGMRATAWYINDADDAASYPDRLMSREMVDVKMDVYTSLFRVFDTGAKRMDRIRHMAHPRITYEFMPERAQDEYPYFDSIDRIDKQNLITFSLTNFFTARTRVPDHPSSAKPADPPANQPSPEQYRFHRFCRFKLEQVCDLDKTDTLDDADNRYFYPLYGEITLTPSSYLYMKMDAEWSHGRGRFLSRNMSATLRDARGDKLSAEHRYTRESVESIETDLSVKLWNPIRLVAGYERNIRDGIEVKNSLGMIYTASCWSLDFRHTKEENDHRYTFMVNLSGLGEMGGNI